MCSGEATSMIKGIILKSIIFSGKIYMYTLLTSYKMNDKTSKVFNSYTYIQFESYRIALKC